jgi:hypothetical protein
MSPCCKIKDSQKFGYGTVETDARSTKHIAARDALRNQLNEGRVPESCTDCPIAESIAYQFDVRHRETKADSSIGR